MASPALPLAQSPPHGWSELPVDLMQLISERLGFADFDRTKSVCSSWLSGTRQSKPNNKIPWMILFPQEKNYCLLFNPENRKKSSTTSKDQEGLTSNSIYFTGDELNWYHTEIFVFNLDTKKVEQLPPLVSSSVLVSRARWFLPSFRNY